MRASLTVIKAEFVDKALHHEELLLNFIEILAANFS
jgi:hypothetical protein